MDVSPNKEQQEVISDFENNIILYASAGTGKTFTVANKVKAITERGLAKPEQILCLTFTIKACNEMSDDIARFIGEAKRVNVKTIHSFCLDIVKEEARLSSDCYIEPTVYDEVDTEEIISKLFPELLTNWYLRAFLRNRSIAKEVSDLFSGDVRYLGKYGFCWKVTIDGQTCYVNSRRQIIDEADAVKLIASTPANRISCPVCKSRQIENGNFCTRCGFDFRTYVAPALTMKNCRNAVSTVKRMREFYGVYSGDEVKDFQEVSDRIRYNDEKTYRTMFGNGNTVDEKARAAFMSECGRLVHAYNSVLRQSNKVDFDDLIVEVSRLFRNPDVLRRWQNKYKFIIVDEMQDTSELEYGILSRIFGKNKVMMCGDISQTIYAWRGSNPVKILDDYRRNFNARVYMLSENYRSTATLTNAAFGYLKNTLPAILGKYCPDRLNVNSKTAGDPIRFVTLRDSYAEAAWVFKYLKKHPADDPSKICIMSRSNNYIANFYKSIEYINSGLPLNERLNFFTVDKDYKFYKRPIVKDILAFVSLLLNNSDYGNMDRIAEKYIGGVGRATLSAIRSYNAYGVSATAFLEEDTYLHGDCFYTLIKACTEGKVVVYDIETTGLDLCKDEIIQLGAVRLGKDGKITEKFEKLVIPSVEIGEGALKTHGYSLEYIKANGGVSAKQALADFSRFVSGCTVVGHNSSKFDSAVVGRQLAECNLPPLEVSAEYDTLALAKLFVPDSVNYKLETLCNKFGIVNERAHDAFEDVVATSKILFHLINNFMLPLREKRVSVLGKYAKKFTQFYGQYKAMRSLLKGGDAVVLLKHIIAGYALTDVYEKVEDKIAVDDLLCVADSYKSVGQNGESLLRTLLTEAALSGSQMDFLINKLSKIPIITVHQSKGCEFETVILIGVDNHNFPSFAAVRSGNEEEEARVFYVAISRAKSVLIMTCNKESGINFNTREPSPYIEKIPQQYIMRYDFSDKN